MKRSLSLGPVLLLGLFGACGGAGSNGLGDTTSVSGDIQGWTQGTGYAMTATINNGMVAMGPIDASGHFALTLPGATAVSPLLTELNSMLGIGMDCTGSLNISTPMSKAGLLSFAAAKGTTAMPVGLIMDSLSGTGTINATAGVYFFANQDFSVGGQQSCSLGSGSRSTTQFNMNLKKGWNTAVATINGTFSITGTMLNESFQTEALPSNLTWQLNVGF